MYYRRFCVGLNDKGKLIPANDSPTAHGAKLGTQFKEYFSSIYKYNEEQYQLFQAKGTIAGITNLITDRLVFDFDSKNNPELAQEDAKTLCKRLIDQYGFNPNHLRVFFSGNKGFHVQIDLEEDVNVDEFKSITQNIAQDLETFDIVVSNPSRIFRIVGSVNGSSNLYKIPLTVDELNTKSMDEIKAMAKSFNVDRSKFQWEKARLPDSVNKLKKVKEETKAKLKLIDTKDIDWSSKPKWLSNCRYSLQKGHFGPGERNNALLCLGATYKNQGFDLEHTHRILKGVAEKQEDVNGQERFSSDEIYTNIISVIYSDNWKGGQFSCREQGTWLHSYCLKLGDKKCNHKDDDNCFIEIDDFAAKFQDFAVNIQQNTLKLGVPDVDDKVMITTSMLVGLLGAPSSGKTTLLLNFLEQSNKDKIDSVFFSMDMGLPLVYLRLIQKHFGIQKEQVFDMFLNNPEKVYQIIETIKEKYKYTKFSFRTSLSVEAMKNAVLEHQEKTGRKVKLIGVDYLECISGPFSDPTANSGVIAQQLKDIANDLDVCTMVLLQTQKQSGDPSDPLLSMRNVKGASVIEQACSVILSLSRPGFSPTSPEDDKFATISSVKDRMGSLMSVNCGWKGLTGSFYRLDDQQKNELKDVLDRKKAQKASENNGAW